MVFSRFSAVCFVTLWSPSGVLGASSVPFSYDPNDPTGPQFWGDLPIDGNQCNGKSNSPIAVKTRPCDRYEDYEYNHGTCKIEDLVYELTTTGVKASFPDTCEKPTAVIPGIPGLYQALQFHIHASSEHTIDGEFFGAELHTVHAEVDGDRYAVVGMMIQPSADKPNELFDGLLHGWQDVYDYNDDECGYVGLSRGNRKLAQSAEFTDMYKLIPDDIFSTYKLIPEGAAYYHYDGGLTTPPCSEVVWWNLADKPVPITPAQYRQLTDQMLSYLDPAVCRLGTYAGPAGSTSRPPQPLNGRTVERICASTVASTGETVTSSSPKSIISLAVSAFVAGCALFF